MLCTTHMQPPTQINMPPSQSHCQTPPITTRHVSTASILPMQNAHAVPLCFPPFVSDLHLLVNSASHPPLCSFFGQWAVLIYLLGQLTCALWDAAKYCCSSPGNRLAQWATDSCCGARKHCSNRDSRQMQRLIWCWISSHPCWVCTGYWSGSRDLIWHLSLGSIRIGNFHFIRADRCGLSRSARYSTALFVCFPQFHGCKWV